MWDMTTNDSSVPNPTKVKAYNPSTRFKIGDRVVWWEEKYGTVFHIIDGNLVMVAWDDGTTTMAPAFHFKLKRDKVNKEITFPSHPYIQELPDLSVNEPLPQECTEVNLHEPTEVSQSRPSPKSGHNDATIPDFSNATLGFGQHGINPWRK